MSPLIGQAYPEPGLCERPGVPSVSTRVRRRLWLVAGALAIAHIVLTFLGTAFEHSLMLGGQPSAAAKVLAGSSMTGEFAGGYIELSAFLMFLVAAMLLAQLLRGDGEVGGWVSSCMSGSAVVYVAVTIATGFAAGAAALYDGHHGAALGTATTVNDIRNFGFILSGAVAGVFAVSTSAAVQATGRLPRWIAYAGYAVGALGVAAVPAARTGFISIATIAWFLWFVALGIVALRASRSPALAEARPAAAVAILSLKSTLHQQAEDVGQ